MTASVSNVMNVIHSLSNSVISTSYEYEVSELMIWLLLREEANRKINKLYCEEKLHY